jgi:hypothetical protein
MERVPLHDSDFPELSIEPRPVFDLPLPESTPPVIVPPASPEPLPDTSQRIAQTAIVAHKFLRPVASEPDAKLDGPTRDEILLTALTIVARKEPQTVATRGAMRDLIRRHSVECGLGF